MGETATLPKGEPLTPFLTKLFIYEKIVVVITAVMASRLLAEFPSQQPKFQSHWG